MKKYLFILPMFFLLVNMAWAESVPDPLAGSMPNAIVMDGKEFSHAFNQNVEGYTLDEYIPKDEKIERFNELIGIWRYKTTKDPYQLANLMGYNIENSDRTNMAAFLVDPDDKNNVIIIFLAFEGKDLQNPAFELNIWRFARSKEEGVIAYQYAKRHYGYENADQFIKESFGNDKFLQEWVNKLLALSPEFFTGQVKDPGESHTQVEVTSKPKE